MRILIAEDAALFRKGLVLLLTDAGHDVVATAEDADAAREAVARHRPELVILDVRMPPRNDDDGARLAAELRRDHRRLAIVLLSQHVEVRHIVSLATGGWFGYLLKDRVLDVDDFLAAIAERLWLTERTVESHVRSLLGKLGIGDEAGAYRRVRAVLAFLEARGKAHA